MKAQFVFTLIDKAAAETIQTWRYGAGFQSIRIFVQHNMHGTREFLEMRREA